MWGGDWGVYVGCKWKCVYLFVCVCVLYARMCGCKCINICDLYVFVDIKKKSMENTWEKPWQICVLQTHHGRVAHRTLIYSRTYNMLVIGVLVANSNALSLSVTLFTIDCY